MHKKIKNLQEIEKIIANHKKKGEKIVQCHGVFDLLHPGHIRHFKEAKKLGDKLVVSITPDKYVNKGPGRPAFNHLLRLESIAALSSVDYVVLNTNADAISAIKHIKPDFYVKGNDYKEFNKDITGKISEECEQVKKIGGKVHFTDDIVFSSSNLINKYIDPLDSNVIDFLTSIKKKYDKNDLLEKIENLKNLKVLIIGDAILDEYQHVNLLGQSGKGHHLVAVCKDKELFLGGSLIIANHIAEFCDNVTLITGIGKNCNNLKFIHEKLDKKIQFSPVYFDDLPTLVKKRYVSKDVNSLIKLFETYTSNENLLNESQSNSVVDFITKNSKDYDLILISDFGNGFINKKIIAELSKVKTFTALNTQINSGNRGFNVVTHYKRADFISLNEPELRLAGHDRSSTLQEVVSKVATKMSCSNICVTLGTKGVFCFSNEKKEILPAFSFKALDRVGAGDSFFALTSLCQAKKYSLQFSALMGSLAAALKVQFIGNKQAIKKTELCKFLVRILK